MTSQTKSRIEYLVPTSNILVLFIHSKFESKACKLYWQLFNTTYRLLDTGLLFSHPEYSMLPEHQGASLTLWLYHMHNAQPFRGDFSVSRANWPGYYVLN